MNLDLLSFRNSIIFAIFFTSFLSLQAENTKIKLNDSKKKWATQKLSFDPQKVLSNGKPIKA